MLLMVLIGWLPFLLIYTIWLVRTKPHRREKSYNFLLSGFVICIRRW